MATWNIECGDCLELLPKVDDASVDFILTDPPYPEIDRDYGMMNEADWHSLMDGVAGECKRVLKPSGSAVFIVQPNYRHVGQMRLWLWEFLLRTAKTWNLIQNVYWWNTTALPTAGCQRSYGLCRNAIKYCLWFGPRDCYRNQDEVLCTAYEADAKRLADNTLKTRPSGSNVRDARCYGTAKERGGSTPFNVLAIPNSDGCEGSGAYGHGAGTAYKLCDWWVRYACPPGGLVLDCFNGAGTSGVAAIKNGRDFIGFEKEERYCEVSRKRLGRVA